MSRAGRRTSRGAYFRQSREARFGRTIEQLADEAPASLEPFRRALAPIRTTLEQQPFLSGSEPLYADYIVCAVFRWISKVSDDDALEGNDPLKRRRSEVLQRFERDLADCRQAL